MWLGTRGLMVEEATTNLITNPSIETATTGWLPSIGTETITRDGSYSVFGDYALKVVTAIAGAGEAGTYRTVTAETVASTEYTLSVWLRGAGTVRLWVYDAGGGNQYSGNITLTSVWTRHALTSTFGVGAARYIGVLNLNTDTEAITFYADGAQLEAKAYATTYADGDQGYDYAWTGAEHASTSTRAATEINLDAHVGLITGNNTWSVRIVARAPYDDDDSWSGNAPQLFVIRGADNNNYVYIDYDALSDEFELYINGTARVSGASSFSAGDWLDIVATLDFTNDSYVLYVNGQAIGTDTTSLSAPTVTQMNVGTWYDGTYHWGGAIAELVLFDSVLTAPQVSQLFELQQALVDTGSMETPGIYILDGKFRVTSSTTGNRIEITADEIAGYDSTGTQQFCLRASDGKAVAGAGDVWLDENGLAIAVGVGSSNQIRWLDGANDIVRIYGNKSGTTAILTALAIGMGAGDDAIITLTAQDQITGTTQLQIISPNVTGYDAAGTIIGRVGGVGVLQVKSAGIKVVGDIRLTDGKAAPATEAGYAILYVDSADGDLKVKFGNGFVRTIAADS